LKAAGGASNCTGSAVCFLTAFGAEGTEIEAVFGEAIRIAKEQNSVSLEKRAEAPTRNIVAKKRAGQEDVDSDYPFGECSQRAWLWEVQRYQTNA
jgi:hypothetical protein